MAPGAVTILLSIALCHVVIDKGGWFPHVSATTCTNTTDFTCPVTLYSTGTCGADGNCNCVSGSSPEAFGCRRDLDVPYIRLEDEDALPFGSEGANFTLICVPNAIVANYTWRLNGTILEETGPSLYVNASIVNSPYGYTCQYSTDGNRTSNQSDVFYINIVALSDVNVSNPAIATQIQGIPTSFVNGTILNIACTPTMKMNKTFEWFHYFVSPTIDENMISAEVTTEDDGNNLFCNVTYYEGNVSKMLRATSFLPNVTDNIPGVRIAEGDRFVVALSTFTLTCVFDEEDFVTTGITITWEWFLNGTKQNSLTTKSISVSSVDASLHQGNWHCAAQWNGRAKRESANITVYVDFPYTVSMTSFPDIPVTNGYLEISCIVNSPLDLNFTYQWRRGMTNLGESLDHTLFFNNIVNDSLPGRYVCTVSIDETQKESTSDILITDPVLFSESSSPFITTNSLTNVFTFGETYLLFCVVDDMYSTPGFRITFLANGIPITTGVANNISFTEDIFDRNFTCHATFNSLVSGESNVVFVSFSGIYHVQVEDTSNNVITSVDAVVNTVINLQCDFTLRGQIGEQANVTWYDGNGTIVGTNFMLQLNVMEEGDVTYFCVAELVNQIRRSSNNVTVSAHVLNTPVLSMVGRNVTEDLDFQETYQLVCDADNITLLFDIRYAFFQDGNEIITDSLSDVYNITNDVYNRYYSCQLVYLTASAPSNNNVTVSFAVLNVSEIHDTGGNVIASMMNAIVNVSAVSLVSFVSLLPGVPDQVNITWYDDDLTEVGTGSTLVVNVREEGDITYFFEARLGSHSMRSSNNITIIGYAFPDPVLSIVNRNTSQNLNFQQAYQLHCDAGDITSLFDIRYTFLKDGIEDVTNSSSDTYNITNDVYNRDYSCQSLYLTASWPTRNNVTLSFAVFDTVEIHDTNGNVKTSMNAIVDTSVTLVSFVTLLPAVPGQASITWYDDALTTVGSDSILVVNITERRNLTFFFEAHLGSHSMRPSDNLTIMTYEFPEPDLSVVETNTSHNLDFQQTYHLHCDVGDISSLFDIRYTFLKDGIEDVTNSRSDTYNITNDVYDRDYSCQSFFLTASSPRSNNVTVSFVVFDTVEIHDTNGNVKTSMNAIVDTSVTLVSFVTLLPTVPGQASITWYDDSLTSVGSDSILVVNITEERNLTFFFEAHLGSHLMRSSDNLTIFTYVLETPVLSMTDNVTGYSLDFSKTYYLHCDVGPILSTIALEYEYSRDGTVVHAGSNDTYAILNDVFDRQYTCHASYQTVTSNMSNSVNASFEVFDALDIWESLRCHVRSEMNPMFQATLTCNVSLLPGVPDHINYTWYDVNNTDIGSASTYSIFVMGDVNTTVTCQAEVGSHVKSFTSTYEVYNITIPCSASCFHLSFTLLVLGFVLTFYLCVN